MRRFTPQSTVLKLCLILLSFLLLSLSGCASIEVIESWNKPNPIKGPYKKFMIIGVGHDENVRAEVENILVVEFGNHGVDAVASHKMIREIDQARRADIASAVHSTGADAVLTVRPVSKGNGNVTQDGESGGIYGTATNFGGSVLAGARTYSDAVLQTNLYDSASTELVWSASLSTYDAERPARVSRDLAEFFLRTFRKNGFL